MKIILITFIMGILLSKHIGEPSPIDCSLVKVSDGDTIVASCGNKKNQKIRLLGIDCPESSHNQKCKREGDCDSQVPKGVQAKNRLKEIITPNVKVSFVSKDKYSRNLGYVYTSDTNQDVGLVLLKEHLCKNVSKKYPHPKAKMYSEAE